MVARGKGARSAPAAPGSLIKKGASPGGATDTCAAIFCRPSGPANLIFTDPGAARFRACPWLPSCRASGAEGDQFAYSFGTQEYVMYYPRDEHRMTSHAMVLLELTPRASWRWNAHAAIAFATMRRSRIGSTFGLTNYLFSSWARLCYEVVLNHPRNFDRLSR